MNRGLFDFENVSPDIDGPGFLSAGAGYPDEIGNGRVDVIGAGIMTRAQLRDLQESARPGYPMIGGNRQSRQSRKSRKSRHKPRHRNKSRKNKRNSNK